MSSQYEPKYSAAWKLNNLRQKYGDCTISELIKRVQGDYIYKCPKCNGRGYIKVEYNGYPNGLPDSDFAYEAAYKDVECDICNAVGYTKKPMKPRMVQDGWEEVEEGE